MSGFDRTPPHHPESEQVVLGSMLLSHKVAESAVAELSPADFFAPRHGDIFSAIQKLLDASVDYDASSVAIELPELKGYLIEVQSSVTTTRAWHSHAVKIREASVRRTLLDASVTIAALAMDGADVDAVCAKALASVTIPDRNSGKVRTVAELFDAADMTAKTEYLHTELLPATHLHRGDMFVLASRPAVGKSAAACQIADELASRHVRTRIYSYEMSASDYMRRFVHRRTEFNRMKQDGGLTEAEATQAEHFMAGDWSKFIEVDESNPSLPVLLREIRKFAQDGGMFVVIDHIQILAKADYEAVTEASRQLKLAANDARLNTDKDRRPVICVISQLNRGSARDDGTLRPPGLADIRQSGAIEQDADVVALLHHFGPTESKPREHMKKAGYLIEDFDQVSGATFTLKTLSQIELAKNRHGKTAIYPAWWSGDHQVWSFVDMTRDGKRV